jgi:hypothetical protein
LKAHRCCLLRKVSIQLCSAPPVTPT